jgi:hypothetical protein
MYLSDQLPALEGWDSVTDQPVVVVPANEVPSVDSLRDVDVLFVLGEISSGRGAQLAGVLNLALPRGLIVLIAYPVTIEGGLDELVSGILRTPPQRAIAYTRVSDPHPAFAEYFTAYGRSAAWFDNPEGVEVIGYMTAGQSLRATALSGQRGDGLVYVVPYFLAGAERTVVRSLFAAMATHREGKTTILPPFLSDLRLPGEEEVLTQIAEREAELAHLREREGYLQRFRQLLHGQTGASLEELVIETLNVVLEGTDYRTEDREDVGVEDFWIVGPEGDFALAEVKGKNTHIRREDVNQVDSHREALGEGAADLPGLLVVNIFRLHDDLDQRQLPVPEQILRRAVVSNVLLLRTMDLYNLLSQKMRVADTATVLVESLGAGGGWLEVGANSHELHQ